MRLSTFKYRLVGLACCGSIFLSGLTSCSTANDGAGNAQQGGGVVPILTTIGTGFLVGGAVWALINQLNQERRKKNKKPLSDAEKAAIIAAAGVLGGVIGYKVGRGIESYVAKKREQYRTEAEYLQAHINSMQQDSANIEKELANLRSQTATLKQQKAHMSSQPVLQEAVGSLSNLRAQDAKKVENYVAAAKKDAEYAYNTTSDVVRKAELKKQINNYETKLNDARQVRMDLTRIAY